MSHFGLQTFDLVTFYKQEWSFFYPRFAHILDLKGSKTSSFMTNVNNNKKKYWIFNITIYWDLNLRSLIKLK